MRIETLLIGLVGLGAFGNFSSSAATVRILDADAEVRAVATLAEAFDSVESNEEIHIYGRHEVVPDFTGGEHGTVAAPLYLLSKTNVMVRGYSGAVIFGAGAGDFLVVEGCSQIGIENVGFLGDRPGAGEIENGIFSMIQLRGSNRDLSIKGCRFEDFGNHGISHLWGAKLSEHVSIRDCVFINGGDTDVPGLVFDGAAVSGIGSHWKVTENHVLGCVRGFELENSGANTVSDVLIANNSFVDLKDLGVMLFATNGDGSRFRDIRILGNSFEDFSFAAGSATAIRLAGGHNVLVEGNTLRGMARQGMSFVSAQGEIKHLQVVGNSISQAGNNGIVVADGGHGTSHVVIANNVVDNCIEAGIRLIDVSEGLVSANICRDNGAATVSGGIELFGAETTGALVIGNKCYNTDRDVQDYGIYISGAVTGAVLRDNYTLDTQAVIAGVRDSSVGVDRGGNKTSLEVLREEEGVKIVLLYAPLSARIALTNERNSIISWAAILGDVYQVQFKDSVDGVWSNLGEQIVAGSENLEIEDDLEGADQRYYRILEID